MTKLTRHTQHDVNTHIFHFSQTNPSHRPHYAVQEPLCALRISRIIHGQRNCAVSHLLPLMCPHRVHRHPFSSALDSTQTLLGKACGTTVLAQLSVADGSVADSDHVKLGSAWQSGIVWTPYLCLSPLHVHQIITCEPTAEQILFIDTYPVIVVVIVP